MDLQTSAPAVPFKFRFMKGGQPSGLLSKRGEATPTHLVLGGDTLRYDDIVDTTTRDNALILVFRDGVVRGPVVDKGSEHPQITVIQTYKAKAADLERYIDRLASASEVARRKAALAAEGKGHLFRSATCPHCAAAIDLSELDKCSYVYCRFCESLFSELGDSATTGTAYKHCEQCALFDRVRSYTEFYFYFLLVIYGFSYKRRHLCDNCAGSLFWKVLLVNLIFILGVPSAIWLKLKSMTGREPHLAELARANALAKKGRFMEAEPLFAQIHAPQPDHPGLLFNQGMGHLAGQDPSSAVGYFERSLRSCANYLPTLRFLDELAAAPPAEGPES